jgi:hypothetical protein
VAAARAKVIEKRNEFWKVRASTTICGPRLGFHGVASRQPPAHRCRDESAQEAGRTKKSRSAVHTLSQPGSRAPGLRILSYRVRRLGSHVAARRPINPCHGNEAGAFRLCTDRVNFLKTAFLTDQVEESDIPTLTFFFRPSAEDEARQTACRLSALIKARIESRQIGLRVDRRSATGRVDFVTLLSTRDT